MAACKLNQFQYMIDFIPPPCDLVWMGLSTRTEDCKHNFNFCQLTENPLYWSTCCIDCGKRGYVQKGVDAKRNKMCAHHNICTHTHTHTHTHTWTHTWMHTYTHVYTHMCTDPPPDPKPDQLCHHNRADAVKCSSAACFKWVPWRRNSAAYLQHHCTAASTIWMG